MLILDLALLQVDLSLLHLKKFFLKHIIILGFGISNSSNPSLQETLMIAFKNLYQEVEPSKATDENCAAVSKKYSTQPLQKMYDSLAKKYNVNAVNKFKNYVDFATTSKPPNSSSSVNAFNNSSNSTLGVMKTNSSPSFGGFSGSNTNNIPSFGGGPTFGTSPFSAKTAGGTGGFVNTSSAFGSGKEIRL